MNKIISKTGELRILPTISLLICAYMYLSTLKEKKITLQNTDKKEWHLHREFVEQDFDVKVSEIMDLLA